MASKIKKGDKVVVISGSDKGKTVRRSKKYHAHDEAKTYKVGDLVRIRECKPISKLKRWEVIGRTETAKP